MSESGTELSKRLVVGHKRDGRSCYDKGAKRELIEACLQPGVSIARMALQHGINANLLRTWIMRYRRQAEKPVEPLGLKSNAVTAISAFVPVVAARVAATTSGMSMTAELPNGVRLELSQVGGDDLSHLLHLLCKLPCSGSTPG